MSRYLSEDSLLSARFLTLRCDRCQQFKQFTPNELANGSICKACMPSGICREKRCVMAKSKLRSHNEWFQAIAKKTCPCGQKHTQVYSWGEYSRARWFTVDHFCEHCFQSRVIPRLVGHAGTCGCTFNLVARSGHGPLPVWLTMPTQECKVAS
jgi:hypothetical protein